MKYLRDAFNCTAKSKEIIPIIPIKIATLLIEKNIAQYKIRFTAKNIMHIEKCKKILKNEIKKIELKNSKY